MSQSATETARVKEQAEIVVIMEDESHVHGFTIFHTTHVTLRLLAGQVAGPAKIDHCSLLIIDDHNGL